VKELAIAGGDVDVIELVPQAPLVPATRYEVAILDPSQHPGTLVFGTFRTGAGTDNGPPVVKNGGAATAHRNVQLRTSCSIPGPWIDVRGVAAEDPGRPKAQILWGVWTRDAAGKFDASRPPATILTPWQDMVTIGRRSGCDPRSFPLPAAGPFTFAVAPLDEAGNAGPLKIHTVDMSAATPEPP
jgi:hypothetical protein